VSNIAYHNGVMVLSVTLTAIFAAVVWGLVSFSASEWARVGPQLPQIALLVVTALVVQVQAIRLAGRRSV
jgi:hypothetical protein